MRALFSAPPPKMRRAFILKNLKLSMPCLTGFLAAVLLIAGGLGFDSLTFPRTVAPPQSIFIEKGMGAVAIAKLLESQHIIANRWVFIIFQKINGISLKAGEYLFEGAYTPRDVLKVLIKGKVAIHYVTLPEGLTSAQIRGRLYKEPLLNSDKAQAIPLPEGCLLPETYAYQWGDTVQEVLQRMGQAQQKFLDSLNLAALPSPLKNIQDLIILASIIEKETALPAELPHVAGVFLNRLRLGIPLQADPTVLYGANITYREPGVEDLKKDTPYNTYLHKGLPPGPICNPGKKALEAALSPLPTDDLYFVADGKGGHVFAKTLKDHQINHAAWRHLRQHLETN